MTKNNALKVLSDDALLQRLSELVGDSRRAEVELIAHIAEVDARKLYRERAASSMFVYCTDVLHFSEGEAYLRIRVARASRKHPMLLDLIGSGRIHLTGIGLLAPHLTMDNRDDLLARATHRSKRGIEELVAELQPRSDVPGSVRRVPTPAPPQLRPDAVGKPLAPVPHSSAVNLTTDAAAASAELLLPRVAVPPPPGSRPRRVEPLAPGRYKIQFRRAWT